jgi:malonate transporter and related proteins
MQTALLLVPDFALILLGAWLGHRHFRERSFWEGLERLVYHVLFPALLFTAIAQANLNVPGLTSALLVAVLTTGVGIALAIGVVMANLAPRISSASCAQCAFRFNSYIALALASRLYGAEGLAITVLIVAVVVPIVNFVAVTLLARGAGRNLLSELIGNPLILATLGGLAFNLLHGSLPEPAWTVLKRLGAAALALGLIAVGAGLSFSGIRYKAMIAAMLTIKHVAMPLAAIGFAFALGLEGLPRSVAIMFAAFPTASSAYILASRMGGDAESVAATVSLSTLIGMVSLSFWSAVL